MESICGANCNNCGYGKKRGCGGCKKTAGCPFGRKCFVAQYILTGGKENYEQFKIQLMHEINQFHIPGMPTIEELNPLNGEFVNLTYTLPNGKQIQYLDDQDIYLGTQVECEFNDGENLRCFGIVANMDFILISEYGTNGDNPELIVYKKR